jgi:hypothetical protein
MGTGESYRELLLYVCKPPDLNLGHSHTTATVFAAQHGLLAILIYLGFGIDLMTSTYSYKLIRVLLWFRPVSYLILKIYCTFITSHKAGSNDSFEGREGGRLYTCI